jgi:hypothetical protein
MELEHQRRKIVLTSAMCEGMGERYEATTQAPRHPGGRWTGAGH